MLGDRRGGTVVSQPQHQALTDDPGAHAPADQERQSTEHGLLT